MNIDEVIDVALRMKNARDTIRKGYGDSVSCIVRSEDCIGRFSARLASLNAQMLQEAAMKYVSMAGLPELVGKDSDKEICHSVLSEHGKMLKRNWFSSYYGVVDSKWDFIGGSLIRRS